MYLNLTDEIKKERCKLIEEILELNNLDFKEIGVCLNEDYNLVNYISVFNKKTQEPALVYELEQNHVHDFLSSFNLVIVLLFKQFNDNEYKYKDDDEIILKPQHFIKIKELYNFYDKKNDVLFEGLIFDKKDCINHIEQKLILFNNIQKLKEIY